VATKGRLSKEQWERKPRVFGKVKIGVNKKQGGRLVISSLAEGELGHRSGYAEETKREQKHLRLQESSRCREFRQDLSGGPGKCREKKAARGYGKLLGKERAQNGTCGIGRYKRALGVKIGFREIKTRLGKKC